MIKALIFDYNQVLADDLEAHKEAYKKAFEKFGLKLNDEELLRVLHKTRNEKISYLKEKHGLQAENDHIFMEKEKEFFRIAKTKNFLFPGTEKALENLAKKYLLAVFTGTNIEQMLIPEKTSKLFKAIVTIKDYTKPKPDPEGLLKCIEKLGVPAKECAYIGDAPHDMTAAKAAGCTPIGKATGTFSAKELRKAGADIVIKDLKELLELKL